MSGHHRHPGSIEEGGIGRGKRTADGVGIDAINHHLTPKVCQGRVAPEPRILNGVQGKDNVIGIEGFPVVPGHITAQPKEIDFAPLLHLNVFGQSRHRQSVGSGPRETLEHQGPQVAPYRVGKRVVEQGDNLRGSTRESLNIGSSGARTGNGGRKGQAAQKHHNECGTARRDNQLPANTSSHRLENRQAIDQSQQQKGHHHPHRRLMERLFQTAPRVVNGRTLPGHPRRLCLDNNQDNQQDTQNNLGNIERNLH